MYYLNSFIINDKPILKMFPQLSSIQTKYIYIYYFFMNIKHADLN